MIKIICLCLLLGCQQAGNSGDNSHQLMLSVVEQRKVLNESEIPGADRRILFRIVNNTDKPVIIPGSKTSHGFFPTGYLVRFDKKKKKWVTPSGNSSQLVFSEVAESQADRHVLAPGKSLKFYDTAQSLYVGNHFQKVVYVFWEKQESDPQIIKSEAFVLR